MKNKKRYKNNNRRKYKKQHTSKKGGNVAWGIIAIISFAIAVYGFVARFDPKVSIYPSFSRSQQNALLTNFEILNSGNTPIKDVMFAISIKNIKTSDGLQIIGDSNFKNRLVEANSVIPILKVNERQTVSFPSGFDIGNNVIFADIALVVKFTHPLFSFKQVEEKFRFTTSRDVGGQFHWAPQSLSK